MVTRIRIRFIRSQIRKKPIYAGNERKYGKRKESARKEAGIKIKIKSNKKLGENKKGSNSLKSKFRITIKGWEKRAKRKKTEAKNIESETWHKDRA